MAKTAKVIEEIDVTPPPEEKLGFDDVTLLGKERNRGMTMSLSYLKQA